MELRDIITHYKPLSERCLSEICSCAEMIEVEPGRTVVRQGEMCHAFYICRDGLMRVAHKTDKGENTILFGSVGDIYTSLHSYVMAEPAVFSLIAVEPSQLYVLHFHDIRDLAERHTDFCHWLMYLAFGQLYALERRYVKYATTSAEQRFHNFLAQDIPYIKRVSANSLNLRVPLKYIASYLQITPATLSRLRRKLVRK